MTKLVPQSADGPVARGRRARREKRRRFGAMEITPGESRMLQAWSKLRRANPWQQPTCSEVAAVLGISPQGVWCHMLSLIDKRVFTRLHDNKQKGRCFALRTDAVATSRVAELLRVATALVKLTPERCNIDDVKVRAEHERAWAGARALIADIVKDVKLQPKPPPDPASAQFEQEQRTIERERARPHPTHPTLPENVERPPRSAEPHVKKEQ